VGSGLCHNQIATISIVTSVNNLTNSGALVNSIIIPLSNIIPDAQYFALRGTVPCSRQLRSVGPYLGCLSNHASTCGQPFHAAHAAKIRKTVVGTPGKIAPMIANTKKIMTSMRQNNVFIQQSA